MTEQMPYTFIDTNMDYFVDYAVKIATQTDLMRREEALAAGLNPISSMFLKQVGMLRIKSAEELASRHIEANSLCVLVEKHNAMVPNDDGSSFGNWFLEEATLALEYYSQETMSQEPSLWCFTAATACVIKHAGDEAADVVFREMIGRINALDNLESIPPFSRALIPAALWFSDYSDFRERLLAIL